MADNLLPWPGSRSEAAADAPGSSGRPDFDPVIRHLPERFKDSGRRLAAELLRGGDLGTESGSEPVGPVAWHVALKPTEAWAVAEAFRRFLESWPGHELHGVLDGALLGAALAAESRTAAAHRRMLEDVSHDIRSPLNSILLLADVLRAERSGPLNQVQSRQMGILYTAAVTLVGLVNDLIDFARLGAREHINVAESPFSVESVLEDVNGLLGPITVHRGVSIRFEIKTDCLRNGDPQLLSRVLLNLVSNAVQAVDEGGHVSVSVDEAPRGDLRVKICDNRVGTDVGGLRALIDSAEVDRLPGETRGWTHGLGLTICARLIKAAEGRLQVTSCSGDGTVFTVELPFRRL